MYRSGYVHLKQKNPMERKPFDPNAEQCLVQAQQQQDGLYIKIIRNPPAPEHHIYAKQK